MSERQSGKTSAQRKRARRVESDDELQGKPAEIDRSARLRAAAALPPALPDWPYVGDIRQKYKFLKRLGSGASGTVFLVADRSDESKLFALKIIADPKEWRDNEWRTLEVLRQNSQCLASGVICHRGHFLVDNIGTRGSPSANVEHVPALLTDYVAGPDLHDFTQQWRSSNDHAPPPASLVRQILVSCLRALALVHQLGFAHRDIKPENIVVRQQEDVFECTLIDFAFACDLQTCASARFSGTPCYASGARLKRALRELTRPAQQEQSSTAAENLQAALRCEQAGDVWALGLALYFFVSGGAPWPCVIADVLDDTATPLPYAIAALSRFVGDYAPRAHERLGGDDNELQQVLLDMLEPNDEYRISAQQAYERLVSSNTQSTD